MLHSNRMNLKGVALMFLHAVELTTVHPAKPDAPAPDALPPAPAPETRPG